MIRRDAVRLFKSVDLIFARDRVSALHVEKLGLPRPRVVPDLTILAEAGNNPRPDLSNRACISPNLWMIERVKKTEAECYLSFLDEMIEEFSSHGLAPFILCHAPFQDLAICTEISNRAKNDIEIVFEPNARAAKAIVGKCAVVLGSRYHSLVAALSQSVPVIATSWAPKYKGLLEDYGCSDCLVMPSQTMEARSALRRILAPNSRRGYLERAEVFNVKARELITEMWDDVCEVILSSDRKHQLPS